jgi:hypothetical protein
MPVIPVLGRKQDGEFKVSIGLYKTVTKNKHLKNKSKLKTEEQRVFLHLEYIKNFYKKYLLTGYVSTQLHSQQREEDGRFKVTLCWQ